MWNTVLQKKTQERKVMQKCKGRDCKRKTESWVLLVSVSAASFRKLLVSGPLSACPFSFKMNEEAMLAAKRQWRKRMRSNRTGLYLLRLTGRLSLFLRRQVLRWYCICVWACPRLPRTGLLTSGGLWKPFTLNLAPFCRGIYIKKIKNNKTIKCESKIVFL